MGVSPANNQRRERAAPFVVDDLENGIETNHLQEHADAAADNVEYAFAIGAVEAGE